MNTRRKKPGKMFRVQFWKRRLARFWLLLRETFSEWNKDNAMRLSAAFAYYTIFSLAPLLIIAIAVAGLFFGTGAARQAALDQAQKIIGPMGAEYIGKLIDLASQPSSSLIATLVGLVTLLIGATGAFVELQQALNTIWKATPSGSGLRYFMRERLLSFALILTIGACLLVFLIASALLAAMGKYVSLLVPEQLNVLGWLNRGFAFGVTTLFFAAIYKILPDVKVLWRDVWAGALGASLLFAVGRYAIGLYLSHSSIGSLYGAAGSFAIVLVWIYYSAQILFLGAEFTEVCSRRRRGKK